MKINISIDDVSPHPYSSVSILEKCDNLIEIFPEIKFSLFIPVAYWRTMKSGTTTRQPLNLSKHLEFCEELKDLDPENYEVGYHGFYHGIPGKSDNDEFQRLTYDEANIVIDLMLEEVKKAGLSDVFKKMFRPPAWRMSPDSFKALSARGFELFALTDLDYALKTYEGSEKTYPSTFSNQFPPFKELKREEKCGIVYHACEWDKNYLSSEKISSLVDFINSNSDSEFCFLQSFL